MCIEWRRRQGMPPSSGALGVLRTSPSPSRTEDAGLEEVALDARKGVARDRKRWVGPQEGNSRSPAMRQRFSLMQSTNHNRMLVRLGLTKQPNMSQLYWWRQTWVSLVPDLSQARCST